jgi:hypothetical protein
MKTPHLVLFALVMLTKTACFAQAAFPSVQAESMDGKNIVLPVKNGKMTLVAMATNRKSEEALRSWYEPLYDKFIAKRGMFDSQIDINIFFVPIYSGIKQSAVEPTKKEIRKSSRTDLYPHILFYIGDLQPLAKALKMDDDAKPYFFLINDQGQIIYTFNGAFSEQKLEKLEEKL